MSKKAADAQELLRYSFPDIFLFIFFVLFYCFFPSLNFLSLPFISITLSVLYIRFFYFIFH
jgi:hypothetical protein